MIDPIVLLLESRSSPALGTGRFSIGLSSGETGLTYHLHLSEAEAERFAAFVTERGKARA
jgi:hypothetical protein